MEQPALSSPIRPDMSFLHGCMNLFAALTLISAPLAAVGRFPPDASAEVTVPSVIVEHNSHDNTAIYSIARDDCTITWIVSHSEANRGVVKHWAKCPDTLARQVPSWEEIIAAFLAKDPAAQDFRTLFWGGLWPERMPNSLELPYRLALAAHRSGRWDSVRGRPAAGRDVNGVVRDIANGTPIYPELKELFRRFQRDITIAVVEKVRILPAKDLPFFDQLRKEGVPSAAKLPFDCMTWFSVAPVSIDRSR